MTWDLIIVGAGAAGLMAAARAAELGCRTLLLEKSSKVGAKILMSGGTRCNITHATNAQGIADAFAAFDKKQAGFLRSSLAALPPEKVIELFEDEGIATKVEDTGKVFPVSNRAVDVRDALLRRAENSGVSLTIGAAVTEIEKQQQGFVVKTSEQRFIASRLLITSGGQSYPGCGTTGDGYWWARQFGHKVVNPLPALTPITTDEQWVRNLQGITLPDAMLSIVRSDPQQEANGYSSKHFLASRPSINPISPGDPTWLTSTYGYRNDPFTKRRTAHHGIDLAGPTGLDIHCTGEGTVTIAHVSRYGYGKEVVVDHGYGFTSRYAHLEDINVKVGQKLSRGEVLGTLGNTGRSTGPHLHYEIRKGGHAVNPMYFFYENLSAGEYTLLASKANISATPYQPNAMSQK
ncbi:MAG: aminoacetone oxidase family FAD-binding enzyme [Fuerstiella sp.]|nr:aminoacetone oxidase family FAD-binding enzyme [Fuerstiella sp.]